MEYGLNCTCDTFFYISRFPLPAHLDLHGCHAPEGDPVQPRKIVSGFRAVVLRFLRNTR
jgi:hypothetical protein